MELHHLQIIVPVFNEEAVLPKFHDVLLGVIAQINLKCSILYVNDGSSDNSLSILKSFQQHHHFVHILDLSRNFGQMIAIRAGLDYCDADLAVVIDSDLQYPPQLIPEMVKAWHNGAEIVSPIYQAMNSGLNHTFLRKVFYKIFLKINPKIPQDAPQAFYLLDKKVIKAISECREHQPFLREIIAFVGFKETTILFNKSERYAGDGKWTLWQQWNYAISGVIASTTTLLKLPFYCSIIIMVIFLLSAMLHVSNYLNNFIFFFIILNMFFLGIMGEYFSKIFIQSRNRPLYFIRQYLSAEGNASK